MSSSILNNIFKFSNIGVEDKRPSTLEKTTTTVWDATPELEAIAEPVEAIEETPHPEYSTKGSKHTANSIYPTPEMWSQTSDLITFDELPDEDTITAQVLVDVMKNLFLGSTTTIEEIVKYIENQADIPSQPIPKDIVNYQYFNHDGSHYMLKDSHVQEVYKIICNMKNYAIFQHTLKKAPNILGAMEADIEQAHSLISNHFIEVLTPRIFMKVTLKAFNNIIQKNLLKNSQVPTEFPVNKIASTIGEAIFNVYMELTFYARKSISEDELQKEIIKFIEVMDKPTLEKAQTYLEYPVTKIGDLQCIINHIKIYALENAIIKSKDPILLKNQLDADIGKLALTLGLQVITLLVDLNIVTEHIDSKNITNIKVSSKIYATILASTTHYKPPLCQATTDLTRAHTRGDVTLMLDINNRTLKQKSNSTQMYPTSNTMKYLDVYTYMPMAASAGQLEDFKRLLEEALAVPFTITNSTIQSFLSLVYGKDFACIVKNAPLEYHKLLEDLFKYGLNINYTFDRALFEQTQQLPAYAMLYNVMSSYKYTLKGLLNDVAVYSKFNYFFIPKYLASTGRTYSKPYGLQLQGIKITRSFITFKKEAVITEEGYHHLCQILKKEIVGIPAVIVGQPYDKYIAHQKYLFIQYVKSYCVDTIPFPEYPANDTISAQVLWLKPYVKKVKNIFYVRTLIQAILANDFYHLVYEKDATSSGLQLIAGLTRRKDLGIFSNIVGTNYMDIYQKFATDYSRVVTDMLAYTTQFISLLFDTTLEEFITPSTPPSTDATSHTTLAYILRSLLLQPATEFSLQVSQVVLKIPAEVKALILQLPLPVSRRGGLPYR